MIYFVKILCSSSLYLLIALLFGASPLSAESCKSPDAQTRHKVEIYILARFKVASAADMVLIEDKAANDQCFWEFKYEVANSKRVISLYLSPDGNYLAPVLYDMRIDPREQERKAQETIANTLLGGIAPELGPKNAKITIVLFSDFECPYCKRMAETIRKEIPDDGSGDAKVVFKNYPLPMHPWAMQAAQAADCVVLQKPAEFWKLHDYFFQNQRDLNLQNIKAKAEQFVSSSLAIDLTQYKTCVDNDLTLGLIQKDVALGKKVGVSATPTMFINGAIYQGAKEVSDLHALIAEALASQKAPVVAAAAVSVTTPPTNQ